MKFSGLFEFTKVISDRVALAPSFPSVQTCEFTSVIKKGGRDSTTHYFWAILNHDQSFFF